MTNWKTACVSITAIPLALASPSYAQNANIGVNAAIKGNVTITDAAQIARQAVVKEDVFLGQVINAKKLSSLQILLKDQTVFTVGPQCELTIDKFVYDPKKHNNTLTANVTKGMFRFMSGKVSKSGVDAVTIKSPVSSMGIRGTMVEGAIGETAIALARKAGLVVENMKMDEGATIFILRGPGPKSTGITRKGEISVTSGGKTVIIRGNNQNKAVFIPNKNATPTVFQLSSTAYQNFSINLRTTPTSPETFAPFELDGSFSLDKSAKQPPQHPDQIEDETEIEDQSDTDDSGTKNGSGNTSTADSSEDTRITDGSGTTNTPPSPRRGSVPISAPPSGNGGGGSDY